MMEPRLRVLITGGAGRIGRSLAGLLKDRYELRLSYNRNIPDERPVSDFVVANLTDYDQALKATEGMHAVVHLAADSHGGASWESVLQNNIIATRNVYEAALANGATKVILASTNHVMGFYDRDLEWPIYASQPPRPDSLYGVSKAFGETLGRWYCEQHGLSVICLRIGWWQPKPFDEISRFMWLSPRDFAQLVWRSIESPLRYGVFYAISGNSRRKWDITEAVVRLGYEPQDDAEDFAAELDAAQSSVQ
jgi:NAD+ dependent glucose-6-phosphate dehydrogenase